MLLSITMIACNYTNVQALVMFLMSLSFFGKGFGALGWTVIADTSPKELIGLNGGAVQPLRQYRRHNNADNHRIHREEDRIIQGCADLCGGSRAAGDLQLCGHRGRH